jgi:3-oxoacyl-[acyl-carrier protein] reductase
VTASKTDPPRHVVLSGGSRGLGLALTTGLLRAGYCVSTFSRRPTEFTDSLSGQERYWFSVADVADSTSLARFVSAAVERFGAPYGLVNCAGIAFDGMLATMREEKIDDLLAVNLGGTLKLTRLIIRNMLKNRQPGVIINISSIIGQRGSSGLAAYAATKAGQDAISRALARELGKRQIRVNSVAPGYLETEMSNALTEAQKLQIMRRTPLKRLGSPGDVVGPVLFLLSDDAAFITGQVLRVDGGISS